MNLTLFFFCVVLSYFFFLSCFSFVSAADASTGRENPTSSPAPATTATMDPLFTCQFLPGHVISGFRKRFLPAPSSLDSCHRGCGERSDCVAYVFRPAASGQRCALLLGAARSIAPNESEEEIQSYMCRGPTPPIFGYCVNGCRFTESTSVRGTVMSDAGVITTATKEECCDRCNNSGSEECVTFQYNTITRECTRFVVLSNPGLVPATSEFITGDARCITFTGTTVAPLTTRTSTTSASSTSTTTNTNPATTNASTDAPTTTAAAPTTTASSSTTTTRSTTTSVPSTTTSSSTSTTSSTTTSAPVTTRTSTTSAPTTSTNPPSTSTSSSTNSPTTTPGSTTTSTSAPSTTTPTHSTTASSSTTTTQSGSTTTSTPSTTTTTSSRTTTPSTSTISSTTTTTISTPAITSSNQWYVLFSFRGINGDNRAAPAPAQWSDAVQEFTERFSIVPESLNKSDFFYSFGDEDMAVEFIAFIIGRFDAERKGSVSAWKFFIDAQNSNNNNDNQRGKPFLFI